MPDRYNFDHLPDRGTIKVRCIENGCDSGGQLWEWSESRRETHFLTHNYELNQEGQPVINGKKRVTICNTCGRSFEQERKRGRPRVQCYVCKS